MTSTLPSSLQDTYTGESVFVRFLVPSERAHILNYLYENRGEIFELEDFTANIPSVTQSQAFANLGLFSELDIIDLTSESKASITCEHGLFEKYSQVKEAVDDDVLDYIGNASRISVLAAMLTWHGSEISVERFERLTGYDEATIKTETNWWVEQNVAFRSSSGIKINKQSELAKAFAEFRKEVQKYKEVILPVQ